MIIINYIYIYIIMRRINGPSAGGVGSSQKHDPTNCTIAGCRICNSASSGPPLESQPESQPESPPKSPEKFPESFSPDFFSPIQQISGLFPDIDSKLIDNLLDKLKMYLSKENFRKTVDNFGEATTDGLHISRDFVDSIWNAVLEELRKERREEYDLLLANEKFNEFEEAMKASIIRKIFRSNISIRKKLNKKPQPMMMEIMEVDVLGPVPVESELFDIVTNNYRGNCQENGNEFSYHFQDDSQVFSSSLIPKITTLTTDVIAQLEHLKTVDREHYNTLIDQLRELKAKISCFDGDHDSDLAIITLARSMLKMWNEDKQFLEADKVRIPALNVTRIHREMDEAINEMEKLLTESGIQFAPEQVRNFVWEDVHSQLLRDLQTSSSGVLKNCVHDSGKYVLLTLFDTFAADIDRGSRQVYDFERIPFSRYDFEIYGVNVTLISGENEEYYIITQMKSPKWGEENSFFTVSHISRGGISQKDAVDIVNSRLLAAGFQPSGIQARNQGDEDDCESSSKSIVDWTNPRFTSLCEVIMPDDEFKSALEGGLITFTETKEEHDFKKIFTQFNEQHNVKKFGKNAPTSWHYILAYFSEKGMGDESAAKVDNDQKAFDKFKENLRKTFQEGNTVLNKRISKCQEGLKKKGYEFEDVELRELLNKLNNYLQSYPDATIEQITSTLDTYISGVNRANYLCGLIRRPISTCLTGRLGINLFECSETPDFVIRMQEQIRGLNFLVVEKEVQGQDSEQRPGKGLEILKKVFKEDVLKRISEKNKEYPESLFLQLIYDLEVIEKRIETWETDANEWLTKATQKYREAKEAIAQMKSSMEEGVDRELQREIMEEMQNYLESSIANVDISRLLNLASIAEDICDEMDDYGGDSENFLSFVRVFGTSRTRQISIPSYDNESLELVITSSDEDLKKAIAIYNFEVGDEDSELTLKLCEKTNKITFKPSIEFLLKLWKEMKKRQEGIQYVNSSGETLLIDNFFIQLLSKRIQSKYGKIPEGDLIKILSKLPESFDRNFGGGIDETPEDKKNREQMHQKHLEEELNFAKQAFTSEVEQVNGGGGGGPISANDIRIRAAAQQLAEQQLAAQGLDSGRGGVAFNPAERAAEESLVYNPMHVEKIPKESEGNPQKKRKYEKKSAPPAAPPAPQEAPPAPQEAPPAPQPAAQPVLEPWYKRLRNAFSRKGGKKINRKTIKKNNSKLMKKSQKRKTIKKRNSKSKKRKTIKKHKSKSIKKLTRRYKK
jgi:hypothetical protein